MKCPLSGKPCNKHKAFYVTEKNKEKISTYQVCEDCLHTHADGKDMDIVKDEKRCWSCGKSLSEIIKDSRVGCAECYLQFEAPMSYIVATVQGTSEPHMGKSPYLWRRRQAELLDPVSFATSLSQKIKIAKRNEDYKTAAKLKSVLDVFQEKLSEYYDADGDRLQVVKSDIAEFIFNYTESESAEGL